MIETRHCRLTARSFVTIGEAHVGLAGTTCAPDSSERIQQIQAAEIHIERGRECTTAPAPSPDYGQQDLLLTAKQYTHGWTIPAAFSTVSS